MMRQGHGKKASHRRTRGGAKNIVSPVRIAEPCQYWKGMQTKREIGEEGGTIGHALSGNGNS